MEKNYCQQCGARLETRDVEGRQRPYCPNCEKVNWRNAKPASAVALTFEDKILVIKRGQEPNKGKWSIPSGFVDYGEAPDKAAVRELEEETGVKVEREDLNFLDHKTMNLDIYNEIITIVYEVEVDSKPGFEAGDDAAEAELWSKDEFVSHRDEVRSHYYDLIERKLDQ